MITNPFTGMTLNWSDQARAKAKEAIARKKAMRNRSSGQVAPFRSAAETVEDILALRESERKAIEQRDARERPLAKFIKPKSSGKLAPAYSGGKMTTKRRREVRAAQAAAIKEKLEGASKGLLEQAKKSGTFDAEAAQHLGRKLAQAERLARRASDRSEGMSSKYVKNHLFNPFTGQLA